MIAKRQTRWTPSAGRRAALLLTTALIVGCFGGKKVDPNSSIAYGLATIDGKPITGGMITIVSTENPRRRATGILRPDGTFRLAGSPIGPCQVILDTTSVRFGDPSSYMPIPSEYSRLETSDLMIDLQPGDNRDIELQCSS